MEKVKRDRIAGGVGGTERVRTRTYLCKIIKLTYIDANKVRRFVEKKYFKSHLAFNVPYRIE